MLVLGRQNHQGVVLKRMLSHAHGTVAIVANGQLGDTLGLHVEGRRRPAARTIELKRKRRGARQIGDDTLANTCYADGLTRVVEQLLCRNNG